MNEKNLRKAIAYLRSGKLKADFDMDFFTEAKFLSVENKRTTCGSVGCVIGHMPYAGIEKFKDENWLDYSERIFGISMFSKEWCWCFSSSWHPIDNMPQGAADRIEWMLEHGVPDNYSEQMFGESPICYKRDNNLVEYFR